jgi:hypothetical protein
VFFACAALTNAAIPARVTCIGDFAFCYCTSLRTVTIGGSVSSIGESAFGDCSSLTSLSIPNSVTDIGVGSFFGCADLTNMTFPTGVTSIGQGAFEGCADLTSITIPDTVTNLGAAPFGNCSELTTISVDLGNHFFVSVAGVLYSSNQTTLIQYPPGNPSTSYTIPDGVSEVGDDAFAGCRYVSSVTIPDGVTTMGNFSFYGCQDISNVIIDSGVVNIGQGAFTDCPCLKMITVKSNNPAYISVAGVLFNRCQTSLIQYPSGNAAVSYTIPASVTNLEDYAFSNCTNLAGIYFLGNAPAADSTVFLYNFSMTTVYYLPGTTGWDTFSWDTGIDVSPWTLPYPLILAGSTSLGAQPNGFGFTVSWATNLNVVIESCTNLAKADWKPLQTITLVNGSFDFTDSEWTNYSGRFYRIRSQ